MTRADYQSNIWEYKRRREIATKKYYEALTTKSILTRKIQTWQKAINRIDERNKKIRELVRKINDFFNVNIKSKSMDIPHKFARSIYFKVGMENKLRGKDLAENIGRNKRTSFRNRIVLTRSFETKPENKKAFYDFKRYIEREENDSAAQRA